MERVDGVVVAADAVGHTFGVRVQWTRLRREGSEGSKGSEGKVDGAPPRGLWPPDGGRLCRRVAEKGS